MRLPKFTKVQIVAIMIVFAVATCLRLIQLNSLPVFADEAIYVRWSQVMRAEPTLRFLPLSDGKQPLFMWIVIPFQKFISDPVVAARIVSVLSGLATLTGVGVLSFVLFGSVNAAIIAGALFGLSPFAVFFDRMALADSMLSMFGVWFMILSILTVKYQRLDLAMISGFILGGALLTKSPALFFVVLIPATLIFVNLPKGSDNRTRVLAKTGVLCGISLIIGYGLYNILRLGPNFHMISLRNQDYVFPYSHIFDSPFDPLKPFLRKNIEYIMVLGNYFVVIFATLGLFNIRKYTRAVLFLLIAFLFPLLVVSEFSKTMTARYIYFTLPYLFVLAGSSILLFESNLRKVFYLLLAGFVVTTIYQNYKLIYDTESANLPRSERYGYLEEWTAGTGIKESSEIIRQFHSDNPEQRIVVGTEGHFGTLPDGLQAYLNDLSDITVIGVGLNFQEVPDSLIESKKSGNKTYFVVNKSRLTIDPDHSGLEIVASFTKADRPEGLWEYVAYGPRDKLLLMEVTDEAIELLEKQDKRI